MDFAFTAEQQRIREAIARLCAQFDDAYWLNKDRAGGFPLELHQALARDGWLGIAMPERFVMMIAMSGQFKKHDSANGIVAVP